MQSEFKEIVKTEEQFREVMGHPAERVVAKVISVLDEHCRAFIARSPFVLVASSDASGYIDVSPKGDPPGFVQVLDDKTLAVPDRLGNRRADTFKNILQNPQVGLLFMIPGKEETLRISGTAMIVRDNWLRERMAIRGKAPDFATVVKVNEAFLHCAKCMIRSKLWETDHWPDLDGLPSIARMMVDHGKPPMSVEEMQALAEDSYRNKLH